mmetsp:Transcript_10722/g.66092  ORF Transcript_10722/g.66092 Transcript_10722/m.66092 type:complete len:160 (+) Transcript_10722:1944-2423(+)
MIEVLRTSNASHRLCTWTCFDRLAAWNCSAEIRSRQLRTTLILSTSSKQGHDPHIRVGTNVRDGQMRARPSVEFPPLCGSHWPASDPSGLRGFGKWTSAGEVHEVEFECKACGNSSYNKNHLIPNRTRLHSEGMRSPSKAALELTARSLSRRIKLQAPS